MKQLNLLGWLCILCFFIAGGTALALFILLWEEARVGIIIFVVSLIAGFILRWVVNERERDIKWREQREANKREEEYQEILQAYLDEEKEARHVERNEIEWRRLRWFEFMETGLSPREANIKARRLVYEGQSRAIKPKGGKAT